MDVYVGDNLKRWICRISFLMLCVIPTGLIVQHATAPSTASQWEQWLSQSLRLPVQIEGLETPLPSRTEIVRLYGTGPDGSPALESGSITVQQTAEGRQIAIDSVTTPLPILVATSDTLQRLAEEGDLRRSLTLAATQLTVRPPDHSDAAPYAIHDLSWTVNAQGLHWRIEFTPGLFQDEDAEVNASPHPVVLERKITGHETAWHFDSRGHRIPGWLLAHLTGWDGFPAEAHLSGKADLYHGPAGWSGRIYEAWLDPIDLAQRVGSAFGFRLTGQAHVMLHDVTFVEGRVQSGTGAVSCHQGRIEQRLLRSCAAHAQMEIVAPWDEYPEIAFSKLNLGFQLDEHLLMVFSPGDPSGTVVTAAGDQKVLLARQGWRMPLEALLKLLSGPEPTHQVLSQPTADLARHLEWPSSNSSFPGSHGDTETQMTDLNDVGQPLFR